LFAMETASLSLFLLAILSANCKKNENEDWLNSQFSYISFIRSSTQYLFFG
jgi:hypothetical protein